LGLGELSGAEPLYIRSLSILEEEVGWRHRDTARVRRDYAELLRALNREEEATQHEARLKGVLPLRLATAPQAAR
jgi:hypothetical protein